MSGKPELSQTVLALLKRGVAIPNPYGVEIEDSVEPERIAPGVVLHTGCRVGGATTSMGPGSVVGGETPATVLDCQLGHEVALKGGYYSGATFLDGSSVGSGAHIRSGTLLEEQANGAHAVGFKQTVLMAYVTAGSLINFCDVLMSGGTSRKNHSEIGSSYIHFNYTPRQDKATASLVGDVPRGVMLDQPPIFLGGQGGLIGPVRIGFGSILPAGVVYRKDAPAGGKMLLPRPLPRGAGDTTYDIQTYGAIDRIVGNSLAYIGNIQALRAWYEQVRSRAVGDDVHARWCHLGAIQRLSEVLSERVERLSQLADKLAVSIERLKSAGMKDTPALRQQETFVAAWPAIEEKLGATPEEDARQRDVFLSAFDDSLDSSNYLDAIAALPLEAKKAGTGWLQGMVDSAVSMWHAPRQERR